ncbi:hypothetical protein OAH87_00880 [Marinomonas sp.]|nr:hypothetical protein [Marinomonas sp.]MDB4837007.1 hypothetical protein [Marinomonas sp.]
MKSHSVFFRFSILIAASFTVQTTQAGLLGFLGDVSSISSAMSNGKENTLLPNYEYEANTNIQKSLTIMEYYKGLLDGNLNTYDSRKAIMDYQDVAASKKKGMLYHKGVLDDANKQDLLYYYELAEEFERNIFGAFQIQPRLQTLYKATQSHENEFIGGRNSILSDAMNKSINDSTRDNMSVVNLQSFSDRGYVVDNVNGFIWQDKQLPIDAMTFKTAESYCAELEIDGTNKWILPWQTRLDDLKTQIKKGRLKLDFNNKTPVEYIWSTNKSNSFTLSNGERSYHRSSDATAAVRCVYKFN